ncbi:MAG: hypothetical protein AAF616_14500 [Bacteroidota bacterium]
MTEAEALKKIKDIPIGSKLELIKSDGQVLEVVLASHEVAGTEKKDYGTLEVPALPPALTVQGGTRFGSFRVDLNEIIKIAWVE